MQKNLLQADNSDFVFNPDTLSGIVFDIRKYSIHDGPGIRTAVFLKGCPLSCWWCHNPEGQSTKIEIIKRENRCIHCGECLSICKDGAISQIGDQILLDRTKCTLCGQCIDECYAEALELVGKRMSVSEVINEIVADLPFYEQSNGGVTFSGGEPLLQPLFLRGLLIAAHQLGIHTAVDTCGYARWNIIDSLRHEVDLFLYDIKVLDDQLHHKYTGVSNRLIVENLRRLSELGSKIIVRFPVIPGINDDEAHVRQLANLVKSLEHIQEIDILPYHSSAINKYNSLGLHYSLEGLNSPLEAQLQEIAEILEAAGLSVKIGG
ncbi:MAG: glycyl-radical enzyme activating protein [Anaerolineales bacterium]